MIPNPITEVFKLNETQSEFEIKRAEEIDLDLLYELEGLLFEGNAWSLDSIRFCLTGEHQLALIARDEDGAPLGYLTGSLLPDAAEIFRIGVLPWQRRQGVGRALADAFFAEARAVGADRALLEVRESNSGARAFYARLGAVELCRRRHYYRSPEEDAVILEFSL